MRVFSEIGHAISEIRLKDETLQCTPGHRFFAGGWLEAAGLNPSHSIAAIDGSHTTVISSTTTPRAEVVHNFAVADDHTFFVGRTGVLVHNDKMAEAGDEDGEGDVEY